MKDKTVAELTVLAENGNAEAQCELASRFDEGDGVEKDYALAVKWYTEAAKQNNAVALHGLGCCYGFGKGVEVNKRKAVELYKRAAELGNSRAQYNLAWCYDNGEGVATDKEAATKWYSKAAQSSAAEAERGIASSQFRLARCYFWGNGVEKDYEKAVEWDEKAAENGFVRAQKLLADMYYKGEHVKKDYGRAIYWLLKVMESDPNKQKTEELMQSIYKYVSQKSTESMESTPKVFISYKSEQAECAYNIKDILINNRIPVWMAPESIPNGTSYPKAIGEAMENCGCVLLLLSKEAQRSQWIEKEIENAISFKKPILILSMDDDGLSPSFRFLIGNIQSRKVDCSKINEQNPVVREVLNDVKRIVGMQINE